MKPLSAAGARYAGMFAALGSEPRLRVLRELLRAHPGGMVVAELGAELKIPASTLSHHLDKLRQERLVEVRREGTFLRHTANTETLRALLGFLFDECCTRNPVMDARAVLCCPAEEETHAFGRSQKRAGRLRTGRPAGARGANERLLRVEARPGGMRPDHRPSVR